MAGARGGVIATSSRARARRVLFGLLTAGLLLAGLVAPRPSLATGPCGPPVVNPVVCENSKPGDPLSDWQVTGVGDASIQGYATSMSVNAGQTISFKIKTPATAYHIDILRLGYYAGNGARLIASAIRPTASLPQTQPACLTFSTTGLVDCGNWGVSASWAVPSGAVSGLYIAHLVRDDTGGSSQVFFVVRNDASHSDILLQTSDATWQAYNAYGGNSLYTCTVACPPGNPGAYKAAYSVSYNRPFDGTIPTDGGNSDPFYAEYQLIRFLERNGYDLSYTSQADVDSSGALLKNHRLFVSSGHDEYWSAGQRASVQAARDAGVNLAFFSGNEIFWKTRWGASSDGSNTPYRTLTTYKETHFDAPTDPQNPPTWTGTWADPRFSPPGDGGNPPNALSGQYFLVNSGSADLTVPSQYSRLRLWRNTAAASLKAGQTLTLAPGGNTLGYEWDLHVDNGFRPAGEFDLSSTTASGLQTFSDYGTNIANNSTATHHLTLYRAASGALVFGAGTVQWAWGLDTTNAWGSVGPTGSPDTNMQQASVNLFADMGIQPTSLMSGLVPASASSDTVAPTSTITAPGAGATLQDGSQTTITGTASDTGGGVVAGVEVSTDGGATWHPATLQGSGSNVTWSYPWTVHGNPTAFIESRAVDDSANLEAPSDTISVSVPCPCSLWGSSVTPPTPDSGDPNAVELGVQFRSDTFGTVSGVRFYKAAANSGTHVGSLWTASGTLLATATFSGETASGWQQVNFSKPVTVMPNTTYVASYFAPAGHYAASDGYFYLPQAVGPYHSADSPPLHALHANGLQENGVFAYGQSSAFPSLNDNGSNYWVEPVFAPSTPPGPVTGVNATASYAAANVTWSAPTSGGPVTSYTITPYLGSTPQTPTTITGNPPLTRATVTGLTAGSSYTFTVQANNPNGSGPVSPPSNAVTALAPTVPSAPTGVVASAGNASAQVSWAPPASDGGKPITSYTVTPSIGLAAQASTTVSSSSTTTSISGLTNGTTYTFAVSATNAVGTGPLSAASNTVTPGVIPAFVQQSSTHNLGASSVTLTPGANVTAGNRIIVEVGVWNGAAATAASVTDSAGNPYVEVTHFKASDNTEMSVWTAPVLAGGGTKPAIAVRPTSSADMGVVALEYSSLSLVSDASAVDQISHASATTGAAGTVASGATPATTGNNELALGLYADSGFGDNLTAGSGFAARANVSPAGDVELLAEDRVVDSGSTPNATVGTGASTTWLMSTVVFKTPSSGAPPTPPGPPAGVSATAGNGTATVSWTAPSDGGSPITSYTVTPFIGSTAQTPVTVTGTSTTISGLSNGTAYTFTVAATNAIGTGPASAASNAVTPTAPTPPGAPTGVSATAGNGTATVSWTAPSNGGSPITSYLVTPYIGTSAQAPTTVSGAPPGTTTTISGLTNGTAYTFTVTAANIVGSGSASAASGPVTPTGPTVPAAPTGVSATAGNGSATVSWTAPSDGGSPITSYVVTPFIGSTAQPSTTVTGSPPGTTTTISGLTNGTAYTFTVTAVNAVGSGPASGASNSVTPTAPTSPGAPSNVTAVAGNASATVSWTAPSNGGSPITSYVVTPYIGSVGRPFTTVSGSPPATSVKITGLTNGTAYTFTVTAANGVGSGPASNPSSAVTPTASTLAFVQAVSKHVSGATSVAVVPTSNVTAGNRLIVQVGVWSAASATAKTLTDSAGNTYTELLHYNASENTELSIWSTAITKGGATKPTITVTPTANADVGVAALEYSGLSSVGDATVVDQMAHATGTTAGSTSVASGATPATTAGNELAMGFYADSGFGDTISAGTGFTSRVNVSPTGDMELLAEDSPVGSGATPNAAAGTGPATTWLVATIVFKAGP